MLDRSSPDTPPGVPSVVVVGSLNVDLIAYAGRLPGPGETVLGDRFAMGFGGKGANQAVMAARLGAAVTMIGALGDDLFAAMTEANLDREGIDRSFVVRVPGSSGVAPIWVEPDGTNRIIVVGGANSSVGAGIAARAVASLPRVDAVIGQFEIPQATTAAAFEAARSRGATTILNPAPAAVVEPSLARLVDWLVVNESELATLAGGGSPVASDAEAAGRLARQLGCRIVVTLGARGAMLLSRDGRASIVEATRIVAVDTTGAGDAFVGAFACGLVRGLPDLDAVRLGVACAGDTVTRPGTQASFPSRARAAEILASVPYSSNSSQPPSSPGTKKASSG
jgi:ribokinase